MRKITGSVTLLAAAMGLSAAMPAQALGLGALEVDSSLFRPVQARIPLLGLGITGTQDVRVSLASPEEFLNLGVDRPHSLKDLRFDVSAADGEAYIRVSSRAPQREPMMQFLVSVEWPGGRLLREYTVLFDPPGWEEPVAPVVRQPATAPAVSEPQRVAAEARSASPRQYGPVRSGETLGRIARRYTGDGIDLNQVMISLLEENPQAFSDSNINRLQRGAVLTVPSAARMAALDPAQAAARVRGQRSSGAPASVKARPVAVAQTLVAKQPPAPAVDQPAPQAVAPAAAPPEAVAQSSQPSVTLRAPETGAVSAVAMQAITDGAPLQQQVADLRRIVELKEEQVSSVERALASREAELESLHRILELREVEMQQVREEIDALKRVQAPVVVPVSTPQPAPVVSQDTLLSWALGGGLALLSALGLGVFAGRRWSRTNAADEAAQAPRPSTLSPSIQSQLQDTLDGLNVEDRATEVPPPADLPEQAASTVAEPDDADEGVISGELADELEPLPEVAATAVDEEDVLAAIDVAADGNLDATGDLAAAVEPPSPFDELEMEVDPDELFAAEAGDDKCGKRLLDEIDVYLAYSLPDQALKLVAKGLELMPENPSLMSKHIQALILDGDTTSLVRCIECYAALIEAGEWEKLRQQAVASGIESALFDAREDGADLVYLPAGVQPYEAPEVKVDERALMLDDDALELDIDDGLPESDQSASRQQFK